MLFFNPAYSFTQQSAKTVTLENIIAKDQTYRIVTNKLFTNNERLCQSVGRRLFGIRKMHTIIASVTQQSLKSGKVIRGRNNKYVSYTSQHKCRNGIVDHWLIINGKSLLAYPLCYRVQACPRPACKYNTFHISLF